MANENINIATFNFDSEKLLSNLINLKNQMAILKNEAGEMRKAVSTTTKEWSKTSAEMAKLEAAGEGASDEYKELQNQLDALTKTLGVQNGLLETTESQLRLTQAEYKETSATVNALTNSENELTSAREKANQMLEREITSIADARASNKEILALRNQLNPAIEEESQLIQELNARLDSNNEFVKGNASAYEQQKINIGNYTESVKDALDQLDPFNMSLTDFIGKSQEAGGAGNLLSNTFKQLIVGIRGVIASSLAFIATPVGATITAIVSAATLLYNIFKSFAPIVDKVEQAMAALGASFNIVKNAVIGLVTGANSLGDTFRNLGSDIRDAATAAAELKKAQQDLEDQMKGQEIQNEKIKGQIEALTIAAKDRTKSEEERLALLDKASKLERQNYDERKKITAEELRIATEEIKIKAQITDAELKELRTRYKNENDFYNAFKELAENRTGAVDEMFDNFQKSLIGYYSTINEHSKFVEQTVNQTNKVIEKGERDAEKARADADRARQEREQRAQQAHDAEINRMRERIDLLRSEQGFRKKDLEEQLDFERRVAADSIMILDKELRAKKISREKYQTEVNNINNELARAEAEIVIQNANDELAHWIKTNESKLENDQYITDEMLAEEQRRIDKTQALQIANEQLKFERGLQTARELQQAILGIEEETELRKSEINERYEAQRRDEALAIRAAEFEQELIRMEEEGATRLELEQAQRDRDFQAELEELERKKISEEQFQAEMASIEARWNKANSDAKIAIEQITFDAKMQLASQAFGLMSEIMGKETAVGKAAAIAQTTIETYKSATSAYSAMSGIPIVGPALGAVAAGLAIATGLMNVKKIVSTKTPKAETIRGYATGGIVDGIPISRSNGDDVLITAKRGEVILNEAQQSRIGSAILGSAGVPGFATRGVVGSSTALVQGNIYNQVNESQMMESISEAVRQGAMEGSAVGSAAGSQSGIRDLSTDRDIMRNSEF